MKHIITLCFLCLCASCAEQVKIKEITFVEGVYDLSEKEVPTKLALLDNNLFHYYTLQDSVEIDVYGDYSIKDNEVRLHPKKELLQPYILFAGNNEELNDSIVFDYTSSKNRREKLFFKVDDEWITNPVYTDSLEDVFLKHKKSGVKSIVINLMSKQQGETAIFNTLDMYSGVIPEGYNNYLLSYNYYYDIRKRVAQQRFQLKGTSIIFKEKERIQDPVSEKDKKILTKSINEGGGLFSDITEILSYDFQKNKLYKEESKVKLSLLKNGEVREENALKTLQ
ncbi:hypothetical protein [Maribacter aquivivus]|uniref:hypothetical protein n=1 Tax=Maribacter aquivivus TaxID=228958 RepID=UPI002494AE15|nr:hypothetical protein [Maribacter aquivivus]